VKVLVTGFGAFPGVPHNVSSDIALNCAARWSRNPGLNVECVILDTEWEAAPRRVLQKIDEFQPGVLILLGVSQKATGLTLETAAYNACHIKPDACDQLPEHATVRDGGKARLATSAPADCILDALKGGGLPVTISDEPGRYVCNAIYHEALTATAIRSHQRCIFIHLPTRFSQDTMTQDDAMRGLDVVLGVMLRQSDA